MWLLNVQDIILSLIQYQVNIYIILIWKYLIKYMYSEETICFWVFFIEW